ncbi:hypothetical protein Nepgr_020699 [Nepenthes gracilis]|uniref:BHLH domain-containing protein n=1 Tax=Nepenthes gracilis TaxID=150966 RepID=A0AAD3SVQ6_NEPGR|nr:hypothetical protein Nepgr_020699 [Nepenthes gracilis]
MDSFDDLLDYSFIDDVSSSDFSWLNQSSGIDVDFSLTSMGSLEQESLEKECTKKRKLVTSCGKPASKACREKLRRERLNDSFLDLSSILEPGRTAKTDKLVILGDAIRVLNQLKTEAKDLKDENQMLLEEIKSLKAEKNELREEKLMLKAEKERIDKQLKAKATANPGFVPPHVAAYHAGANKMPLYPGYSVYPMWHYMPPTARDTSRDHELRPPAA